MCVCVYMYINLYIVCVFVFVWCGLRAIAATAALPPTYMHILLPLPRCLLPACTYVCIYIRMYVCMHMWNYTLVATRCLPVALPTSLPTSLPTFLPTSLPTSRCMPVAYSIYMLPMLDRYRYRYLASYLHAYSILPA